MKFLHTADWHIGKIINEYSMIEDQKFIIDKLFAVIELEKPDVIVIAGDVYDRSIPPKEAIELLDFTLTKIIEFYKIPTLIISGNHDSSERLSFGNKLLEHKNLFIQGLIFDEIKKVTINDEYGPVNFYLVPYAHPMNVKYQYNDTNIIDHNSSLKAIIDKMSDDFNEFERNILITHNYLISSSEDILTSDSERSLTIGGTEYVDATLVEKFDYVALGHLHKPQKVKHDYIRYSGSLLKYSFSETDFNKGVNIIELKEKSSKQITFIQLEPIRDMRIIKGELNTLIDKNFYSKINCDDYICAILTDKTDLYNPADQLRTIYPNLMQIQRNNNIIEVESSTRASTNFKSKSTVELFEEFYENIQGMSLDDNRLNILKNVIDEVEKEESDLG
ncbi:MAG: sbcD [Haloplasmataceae bacterium]|jgi:exonuclease SbcD|nr:sbcD [Haloplasmataceae bacterium]